MRTPHRTPARALAPALALALALAPALAGCLAPPEEVDAASVPPTLPAGAPLAAVPIADKNLTVEAPEWRVGDAWTVEVIDDEAPERATLVVVSASSSSYELASTSERQATYNAMFDISYLGKIRASDLAGHQQDQPVQFFSFPMTDGKRWTTTWDRDQVELHAGFAKDIPTPMGPQPGFRIQGTRGGEPYVEYDYVPALRWWSHILFSAGYGIKVTGASTNWTGTVPQATAKSLLTLGPAAPVGSTPAGVFTVDEGQTVVALQILATAPGPFARAHALVDPDGRDHGGPVVTHGTAGEREFLTLIVPAKAGQWRLLAPSLHQPGGGVTVNAYQVMLEPRAVG